MPEHCMISFMRITLYKFDSFPDHFKIGLTLFFEFLKFESLPDIRRKSRCKTIYVIIQETQLQLKLFKHYLHIQYIYVDYKRI